MFCTKCGMEFTGDTCPNCGAKGPSKPKKKKGCLIAVLVIIALFVIIGIIALSGGNEEGGGSSDPQSSQSSQTQDAEDSDWKKSGMYKVGSDIPAGEYFLECTGMSAYVEVSSSSSGTLEDIVTNDNFSSFRFVEVKDGQYLTVTGAKFKPADKATVPAAKDGVYEGGMYRVGKDIPAGEYLVTPESGMSAYVEVSAAASGLLDDIVTNDNITAQMYITVKDGQYLTVVNGSFKAA